MSNLINLEKFNIYTESPRDILKKEFDRINQITDLIEFEIKNESNENIIHNNIIYYDEISIKSKYFDYNKILFKINWFNNDIYPVSIDIEYNSPLFRNDFFDYVQESYYIDNQGNCFTIEHLSADEFKDFLKYLFNSKIFINEINKILEKVRAYKICNLFNKEENLEDQRVFYKEGAKEINYVAILKNKIVPKEIDDGVYTKSVFLIVECDCIKNVNDDFKHRARAFAHIVKYHFIQESIEDDENKTIYKNLYPVEMKIKKIKEYNKL